MMFWKKLLINLVFQKKIITVDFTLTPLELLSFYPFFYISIPMRFHGTLFSIHTGVPMIPIYTTKKIHNLLKDIEWEYFYKMEKNAKDLPIEFNSNKMLKIFLECIKHNFYLRNILRMKYENYKTDIMEQHNILSKLIIDPFEPPVFEEVLDCLPQNIIPSTIDTTITILDIREPTEKIKAIYEKLQLFAKEHGIKDFREKIGRAHV